MNSDGDAAPDAELVAALKRRDASAYANLVKTEGSHMYRIALRITRNPADAGDAVQEAFIGAFRAVHGFEGRSSLRTWLHRLTVNTSLMRLRSRARRNEVSIDELAPNFEGLRGDEPQWAFVESGEDSFDRETTRAAVTAAIEKLPDAYRVVVVLRDLEGMDTREVAEMLDDTEGNVKVRLHRARAALKKLLEPIFPAENLHS